MPPPFAQVWCLNSVSRCAEGSFLPSKNRTGILTFDGCRDVRGFEQRNCWQVEGEKAILLHAGVALTTVGFWATDAAGSRDSPHDSGLEPHQKSDRGVFGLG
jgi:hypothetical protein